MHKVRRLTAAAIVVSAAALSACAPTLGPPPPPRFDSAPPSADNFRAGDFSWSAVPGHGSIGGHVSFKTGQKRYTCTGASVILTPETPWSRHRMSILYKSADHAALPADEVRARTPSAPAGDYSAFVRRTTCGPGDRFSFSGLPEGAWYVITIAKPAGGGGPSMALMKRAVTRDGRLTNVEL